MSNSNKIWCDVWDHVILRDKCLFPLGKVAKENKSCLGCICYENMEMKKRLHQRRSSRRAGRGEHPAIKIPKAREPIQRFEPGADQFYTSEELIKVFGRSLRTIQEWAQTGRAPSKKIGPHWRFPKEEIDQYLKQKGKEDGIKGL